jgi:hypothetical protein
MLARRFLVVLLAGLAVASVSSATAGAEIIVKHDASGRPIEFDVQAPGVDVAWYATLLSQAAHGDEIANVMIRIVSPSEIHERCGHRASACYSGGSFTPTITVPAGKGQFIASILLHEYAHHLDREWSVNGSREPNGTPVWWALRGMAEFVRTGAVSYGYRSGWERGIGEIFAEDYAYVHVGGDYGISWLYPPDSAFKKAFLAELRGATTAPPPAASIATMIRPVTIERAGTIDAGERHDTPFELLGPGRRVVFTAALTASGSLPSGARMQVSCGSKVVQSRLVRNGRATLDVRGLGPAKCRASLVSTTGVAQHFSVRIRLAIEPRAH